MQRAVTLTVTVTIGRAVIRAQAQSTNGVDSVILDLGGLSVANPVSHAHAQRSICLQSYLVLDPRCDRRRAGCASPRKDRSCRTTEAVVPSDAVVASVAERRAVSSSGPSSARSACHLAAKVGGQSPCTGTRACDSGRRHSAKLCSTERVMGSTQRRACVVLAQATEHRAAAANLAALAARSAHPARAGEARKKGQGRGTASGTGPTSRVK